jgi:SAM-dependent methyltransferase
MKPERRMRGGGHSGAGTDRSAFGMNRMNADRIRRIQKSGGRRFNQRLLTSCFLLLASGSLHLKAAAQEGEKLAPYYPTPETIVARMLQLGGLKAGEKMYDLGSGDGRIVIMAAQKFHANALGVELDQNLCLQSEARIRKLGLEKVAHIIHGDLLNQDYSSADLITVYLWPEANNKLQPVLDRQMKKGARVVAHDFEFGGWKPEKIETVEDDGAGRSHTLFLYRK